MSEEDRKLQMLYYELKLKDFINSKLQEELNKVNGRMSQAIGATSSWQYDKREALK